MEDVKIELIEKILDYAIKKEIVPTNGFFEKVIKLDVGVLEKICNKDQGKENHAIQFLIKQSPSFSDTSVKRIIEELSERDNEWLYYNVGMENKLSARLIEEIYGSEFFLEYIDIICEIEKSPVSRLEIRNFQTMIANIHRNNKEKLPTYILEEILERVKNISLESSLEDTCSQLCDFYSQFTDKDIVLINETIGFEEYHNLLKKMIAERERNFKSLRNIYSSILRIQKTISQVKHQNISTSILKEFFRKIFESTLTYEQLQSITNLFKYDYFQELLLRENRKDELSFSTSEIILEKLISESEENLENLTTYIKNNSFEFNYLEPEQVEENLELAKKYNYSKISKHFISLAMRRDDCLKVVNDLMTKYQILDSDSQLFVNELIEFLLESTEENNEKLEKVEKLISIVEQGMTKKQIDNISKNVLDETEYFENHDRCLTLNEWEMLFEYSKIHDLKRIDEEATITESYSKYFDILDQLKNKISKDKVKKK